MGGQLRDERVLPGEEERRLDVEGGRVMRAGSSDEQALGTTRSKAFDDPEDTSWPVAVVVVDGDTPDAWSPPPTGPSR